METQSQAVQRPLQRAVGQVVLYDAFKGANEHVAMAIRSVARVIEAMPTDGLASYAPEFQMYRIAYRDALDGKLRYTVTDTRHLLYVDQNARVLLTPPFSRESAPLPPIGAYWVKLTGAYSAVVIAREPMAPHLLAALQANATTTLGKYAERLALDTPEGGC